MRVARAGTGSRDKSTRMRQEHETRTEHIGTIRILSAHVATEGAASARARAKALFELHGQRGCTAPGTGYNMR
jgi:hypothetical protein